MNVIVLRDYATTNGDITSVIVSENYTSKDIEDIIIEVKNEKPGSYSWDDIAERLPEDCTVYDYGLEELYW